MKQAKAKRSVRSRFWVINFGCASLVTLVVVVGGLTCIMPRLRAAALAHEQVRANFELQAKLADLQRDQVRLEQALHELQESLVSRYDVPSPANEPLLDAVTGMIGRHDLKLVAFSEHPAPSRDSDGRSVELQLQGSYSEICAWLEALGRLARPVRITQLQLSPNGVGDECSVQAELKFFSIQLRTESSKA